MKGPFVVVALLYTAGIIAGIYLALPLLVLFVLCYGCAFCALFWAKARHMSLLLGLLLFGWTNLACRTAILAPSDLRRLLGGRAEYVTLTGTLLEQPTYREHERNHRMIGRSTAPLQVERLSRNGEPSRAASGQVVASVPGSLAAAYFSGQQAAITGVLQPPRGRSAPGQFDYGTYLRYQGIYYLLRTESTNDWRIDERATGRQVAFCDRFCRWAQGTLARGLPGEDEALRLLWAMVLGWKTALTQEVAEPFMQSGTLHIFAISGLHIALISGILVQVFRVVRLPRAVCGAIVIPLIWFYTLATGWQASAIRSTIMMTIVILGWSLERPSGLLNSLAAAGTIILVGDPRQLFQAGFQLSFFVVLGLALIIPPIERIRARLFAPDPFLLPELRARWKRFLEVPIRVLATSFSTSLAAWIGSMPLIAYYFYMVTPGSLFANLVIVPLSSIALMSSLGSLVCGDWLPICTELFNHASWLWMELMIRLSRWFASRPGAFWNIRAPTAPEFALYYGALGAVLSGAFARPRLRLGAGLVLGLLLGACLADWTHGWHTVSLTVLPERGAVFVDAPGRAHDLLLDTSTERAAESLVKPFLRSQGVNRLPTVLLTQGDLAHVGGLAYLQKSFVMDRIVTSKTRGRSPAYRALLKRLEQSPASWRQVQRGDLLGPWSVLHPAGESTLSQAANNAVVLRGRVHETRVLFLSELGRLGQRELLAHPDELRAEILLGGPEGFADELLDRVRPELIVIAGGEYPAWARPNALVRQRLAQRKVPVIYTWQSGAAVLDIGARGWRLRS